MNKRQMMRMAAGLLACVAAWGQPVGAVRGQGQLAMNGRAVQRSATATFLKAGDEVAVQTGKAVVDLIGGTRLYLEPGAKVKLEAGSQGALGVRVLSGQGAFRLGEGASMAGVSGARQGLIAVERTLARVYPMVSMIPVADAGTGRAASTVPPIRSVDVSTSTLPPAPPAVGTVETPKTGQTQEIPTNLQPGGTYTQTSYFTQANGQPPAPTIVPGGSAFMTILSPSGGMFGVSSLVSRDDEALWWLAGGPSSRRASK
jgi:hypothetical protein